MKRDLVFHYCASLGTFIWTVDVVIVIARGDALLASIYTALLISTFACAVYFAPPTEGGNHA